MYKATQTMGARLRIRSVEAGKVKTDHTETCRLRPHIIAVRGEEEAKRGNAAALQRRATEDEANVTVPRGDHNKAATTKKPNERGGEALRAKPRSLP